MQTMMKTDTARRKTKARGCATEFVLSCPLVAVELGGEGRCLCLGASLHRTAQRPHSW
jgi:hypothetical protein